MQVISDCPVRLVMCVQDIVLQVCYYYADIFMLTEVSGQCTKYFVIFSIIIRSILHSRFHRLSGLCARFLFWQQLFAYVFLLWCRIVLPIPWVSRMYPLFRRFICWIDGRHFMYTMWTIHKRRPWFIRLCPLHMVL